jgi:hypothetical protein
VRKGLLAPAAVVVLAGCASIGPGTVERDRFEYSASIGESWKRQTLLNIVKMRYLDPPLFVDVGQIVAGYTFETAVSVGGTVVSGADSLAVGGSGRYTDRPTVTYTPLTGNRFLRSLMTPLPPESVFFTIQSGWAADAVLLATVTSINRLKNQEPGISGVSEADPEFLRVAELMRKIQLSGAVALRVREQPDRQQRSAVLAFRAKDVPPETLEMILELRRLLHLDPDATDFELVFGATPTNDRELAVLTRSLMHMLMMLAAQVDVPAEDVEQGRATPGVASTVFRIASGKSAPRDAFVAIPYRNHWFWIDDRDLKTKRAFALMMLVFTLAETGEKENLPLITIPAQ